MLCEIFASPQCDEIQGGADQILKNGGYQLSFDPVLFFLIFISGYLKQFRTRHLLSEPTQLLVMKNIEGCD